MSDGTHAKYSPSQLPRIIGCPGSTTFDQTSESSVYANEGTDCHTIMADHLMTREFLFNPEHKVFQAFNKDNQLEYGGAIQDCLDYAFNIISQYDSIVLNIEEHVSLTGLRSLINCPSLDDVAGTADLIIKVPDERIIHVIDWKFGVGEVSPDSDQLKAYGAGALERLSLSIMYDEVHLHIGQPRTYAGAPFKVHVMSVPEVLSWVESTLVPALNECEGHDPIFRPSEKACQWCVAKATCTARYNMAQQTAVDVFRIHAELPNVKSVDELADFLERSRNLKSYVADIEGYIVKTLKAGTLIPGLKMIQGNGKRRWVDEKKVFKWATDNVPEAEIFDTKLLSPSKMEKLVKRKLAKTEDFQALYTKPEGKQSLVKEDDPREAVVYQTASEIFADYTEED